MVEEQVRALRERMQDEISGWLQVQRRYDGQLLETQVVLDNGERTVQRIDHPRVVGIPTLRYGSPNAQLANWTLLMPERAQQLVQDLDRQQPAFAPHRAQGIRELIRDRIAAAERGLRLLEERFPALEDLPEVDGEDGPSGMRP